MKSYLLYILAAGLMLFSSCRKNELPEPQSPEDFAEIVAKSDFSWETTRTINLEIEGLETPVQIVHTLKVMTLSGDLLLQKHYRMSETSVIPLQVPAYTTELLVEYSTLTKTVSVTGGTAFFDFITELEP